MLATGFQDFMGQNFIIAKDGVYCIDTEHSNFDQNTMPLRINQQLSRMISPDDNAWINEVLQEKWSERLRNIQVNRPLEGQKAAIFKQQEELHGYDVQRPEFNFSLDELE